MGRLIEEQPEVKPDLTQYQVEDNESVDSVHTEKQHRLLTVPLSCPWPGLAWGRRWMVFANVGYFYRTHPTEGLEPNIMLSLDVEPGDPLRVLADQSYFLWERGKPPEVVIEVVSDRRVGELEHKRSEYAQGLVRYYAVFDPCGLLGEEVLQTFERDPDTGEYVRQERAWFAEVGLGLTLWQGTFERLSSIWLRWCDEEGHLIPTLEETLRVEQQRVEEERQRAEQERQRLEQLWQRAEQERQRAERLAARLRELGINPDEV